ncbi:DNA-3-methyladenine glycosylase 2 family protein [Rhodoferax fermentans]|uniref:DNA-3-methyladenine glycosylase II n=1 Tax=Rhodoferax fermentans TaxID=28066 RepID=A0A1T1AW85_RHOFE|nr:AlkA N-terminal domain-containing protein [Rhodoferax fermentans]MBK1685626.1 adenosine deaminase [Rhodoferax fermentans]OOV08366.1 adenosine deaminase [Rhodoferax fermentans]
MFLQPTTAYDDACYLALKARDARFDGNFFTGVTSTGIYCRPVCRVRTPKRDNCRFFPHAALAEQAGFRPCLRCRPELAPAGGGAQVWSMQDASSILAQQAARLMDAAPGSPSQALGVATLAQRLGISDRHLRRIFEAQFGVSPLQYLQTRRLLCAKQLLTDTRLPATQVAQISGFASVRRFNAVFAEHYGLNPTQLRRSGPPSSAAGQSGIHLKLAYRPPYDVAAMLQFLARRQVQGTELVSLAPKSPGIAKTLSIHNGSQRTTGWVVAQFDDTRCRVDLTVSDSLAEVLPQVMAKVRALLDLDADPSAINQVLHTHFPNSDGLRLPGAFDGFELAVRAVLGQQITVAAARTLCQRLVVRFGETIQTPVAGLDRLFPSAETLATASGEVLGQLGIVKQRQNAILALAHAVASGALQLQPGADPDQTRAVLQTLPGIGDWTAQYICMRALHWPDAFPAGDVALHNALGVRQQPNPAQAALAAATAWQPWRSYAVIRAWANLPPPTSSEESRPITMT